MTGRRTIPAEDMAPGDVWVSEDGKVYNEISAVKIESGWLMVPWDAAKHTHARLMWGVVVSGTLHHPGRETFAGTWVLQKGQPVEVVR